MYSTLDKKKKCCFISTFVLALGAVALLSVSMATDYWVVADPVRIVDQATVNSALNVTGDLNTKFKGEINFGLFHGYKELDHGLRVRKGEVTVLFSMAAFVLYLVLFVLDLRENVLSPEDRENFHWTSDERADLHYSFYLVVIATVLFGVNIILVFCAGVECKPVKYRTSVNDKALDGVMMY